MNQCHSCHKFHEEATEAARCFLSHCEVAEDFLPDENETEKIITDIIEGQHVGETAISALKSLGYTVEILDMLFKKPEENNKARIKIAKALAAGVFNMRVLCQVFASPEELANYVDEYARKVKETKG